MVEHVAVAGVVVVVFVVVVVALTMSPPPWGGGSLALPLTTTNTTPPTPWQPLPTPQLPPHPLVGVCCVLVVLFGKLFMQNLVF